MYISSEGLLIILFVGLVAGWLAGQIVQGTGLGLSICKAVLREHGGNIEVTPASGGGAAFTVTLPFDSAVESSTGEPGS